MTIHHGDCIEVMAQLPESSIDAIVTDPPYGLEFMGKEWDRLAPTAGRADLKDRTNFTAYKSEFKAGVGTNVGMPQKNPRCRKCGKLQFDHEKGKCKCPSPDWNTRQSEYAFLQQVWHERWATAALRVAKPGAYLLAFGGTRTVHRMTVALEDAGWIIRDMLVWAYASGFPKSRALLKPAWEPIVMARKPGPLRDLDIDGCRIGTGGDKGVWPITDRDTKAGLYTPAPAETDNSIGRWPANVVLTDPIFDGDIEGVVGGGESRAFDVSKWTADGQHQKPTPFGPAGFQTSYGDTGTYSRYFLLPKGENDEVGDMLGVSGITGNTGPEVGEAEMSPAYPRWYLIPKASRSDREPVMPGMLEPAGDRGYGQGKGVKTRECRQCGDRTQASEKPYEPACRHGDWEWVDAIPMKRRNVHPTVKPIELMRHLVRLVTPAGGTVLDPFLGSGTTALAAEQEARAWVGIEREAEYVRIAEARLSGWQRGMGLTG